MPSRPNLLTRDINLGPLVDLLLVFLMFPVVVMPMLRHDPPPALPRLAVFEEDKLAVAMGADGAVFVDRRRVAEEELPELLLALYSAAPDRAVLLTGDGRLRYSQVRRLMGEIYRAGFQRVALIMEPRPVAG